MKILMSFESSNCFNHQRCIRTNEKTFIAVMHVIRIPFDFIIWRFFRFQNSKCFHWILSIRWHGKFHIFNRTWILFFIFKTTTTTIRFPTANSVYDIVNLIYILFMPFLNRGSLNSFEAPEKYQVQVLPAIQTVICFKLLNK